MNDLNRRIIKNLPGQSTRVIIVLLCTAAVTKLRWDYNCAKIGLGWRVFI